MVSLEATPPVQCDCAESMTTIVTDAIEVADENVPPVSAARASESPVCSSRTIDVTVSLSLCLQEPYVPTEPASPEPPRILPSRAARVMADAQVLATRALDRAPSLIDRIIAQASSANPARALPRSIWAEPWSPLPPSEDLPDVSLAHLSRDVLEQDQAGLHMIIEARGGVAQLADELFKKARECAIAGDFSLLLAQHRTFWYGPSLLPRCDTAQLMTFKEFFILPATRKCRPSELASSVRYFRRHWKCSGMGPRSGDGSNTFSMAMQPLRCRSENGQQLTCLGIASRT